MEHLTYQEFVTLLSYGETFDLVYEGVAYHLTWEAEQLVWQGPGQKPLVFTSVADLVEFPLLAGLVLKDLWPDLLIY